MSLKTWGSRIRKRTLKSPLFSSRSFFDAVSGQESHLSETPFTSQHGLIKTPMPSPNSYDRSGYATLTIPHGASARGLLPRASAVSMPELDGLKEQLVYLRLWLGIMVVAEISLIGWLASALETATSRLLYLAILGIMSLGLAILLLHRRIGRRIKEIRSL